MMSLRGWRQKGLAQSRLLLTARLAFGLSKGLCTVLKSSTPMWLVPTPDERMMQRL